MPIRSSRARSESPRVEVRTCPTGSSTSRVPRPPAWQSAAVPRELPDTWRPATGRRSRPRRRCRRRPRRPRCSSHSVNCATSARDPASMASSASRIGRNRSRRSCSMSAMRSLMPSLSISCQPRRAAAQVVGPLPGPRQLLDRALFSPGPAARPARSAATALSCSVDRGRSCASGPRASCPGAPEHLPAEVVATRAGIPTRGAARGPGPAASSPRAAETGKSGRSGPAASQMSPVELRDLPPLRVEVGLGEDADDVRAERGGLAEERRSPARCTPARRRRPRARRRPSAAWSSVAQRVGRDRARRPRGSRPGRGRRRAARRGKIDVGVRQPVPPLPGLPFATSRGRQRPRSVPARPLEFRSAAGVAPPSAGRRVLLRGRALRPDHGWDQRRDVVIARRQTGALTSALTSWLLPCLAGRPR